MLNGGEICLYNMSKAKLKKLLEQLNHEQVSDLIIELYEARSEAKEYLDFYVQPDIDKRMEKARANIKKEFMRSSRGRNKGRITRIKRFIKDVSSLNPGVEYEIELKTFAIETACRAGSDSLVKETTQRAVGRLIIDTVMQANSNGLLPSILPRIETAVDAMPTSLFSRNQYRRLLKESLKEAVENL